MVRKGRQPSGRPESEVRRRLLEAGAKVLAERGFYGASARVIAEEAGVAAGSVHYHFDSVDDLLLAALDEATTRRLEDYRALAERSGNLGGLLAGMTTAFAEDRDAGFFRLLAQLLAASAGSEHLAAAMAERTVPWVELAQGAVTASVGPRPLGLVDAADVALAVVAFFIGLELLDEAAGDRFDTAGLLARLAGALGPLGGSR